MTSILKNFATAGQGEITDAKTGKTKVNPATVEKNAMKSLLEGLDAQQKSVNQMPSTHKMGKNGAKHPASKFLVGGEHDDDGYDIANNSDTCPHCDGTGETDDGNWYNKKPCPACDGTGKILDEATPTAGAWEPEGITRQRAEVRKGEDNYGKKKRKKRKIEYHDDELEEDTISKRTPPKTQMNKKQSFKDIFRSMDETEEDMSNRFKKELHDEREERILNKGTNGKFDLAERFHDGEELSWGDELLEDLKLLLHDAESYEDLRDGVLSAIQQYEE